MKLILTESQVKNLMTEIASLEDFFKDNNPLTQVRNSLETDAPTITKFVKNLGDNSIGGTIKKVAGIVPTIKGILGKNNTDNTNVQFAQNIPSGNAPMNPLGHKTVITSNFGHRNTNIPGASSNHKGIDLAAPSGSPVYAPLDGTVISSRDTTPNPCGGFIQLTHTNMITKFCHLRQMVVKQGDIVKKGQIIGYSGGGATDPMHGDASGPHLHYEILDRSGAAEDPLIVQNNLA